MPSIRFLWIHVCFGLDISRSFQKSGTPSMDLKIPGFLIQEPQNKTPNIYIETNTYSDPWADPKSRSTLEFHNLDHRSIGVQNWGLYFVDPPRGLGILGPKSDPQQRVVSRRFLCLAWLYDLLGCLPCVQSKHPQVDRI